MNEILAFEVRQCSAELEDVQEQGVQLDSKLLVLEIRSKLKK